MARPDSDPGAAAASEREAFSSEAAGGREERRLVTALFADLVGFTALGEERDPEEVRAIQREYFEAVAREVERFGGSIEKYIGDAAVAVFGVPRAHDDDAERALRAALAIRSAVAAIGGLELRIGVNTGEVVGGAADARGGYVVAGDAMNIAARLQQAADPGTILVGPVTRRLAAADFDFRPAGPLEVKGKSLAVEAAQLSGLRERAIRVHLGTAELVGREGELQSLETSLREAISGRGRVVAIIGEAGIGKSRLALEVRRQAAEKGATVAWAAARSYASGEPYFLVSRLVRELLGATGERPLAEVLAAGGGADAASVERWSGVLTTILGGSTTGNGAGRHPDEAGLTPQGRQRALADALAAIVADRSARGPMVIVLDDLHWADAASQQILDELVDAIAETPVLVVATARPSLALSWTGKRHYRQLNLDSLAGADALRLALELAGERALPAEVATELLERSGGNPFFLEELVASTLAGDVARGRLPETVQEVVLARVDALAADPRRTLQLASVVGMEFAPELIEVLDPPPDLSGSLNALRREDLIVRRPGVDGQLVYVFRHPLIQEVAYRSVLVAQRRQLHGRLARHLEAEGREELVPAVAVHYRASDDTERARAALVRAAERAERLFATSEATRFYHDAAELTRDEAERAALLERAAFQAYQSGAHDRAITMYGAAIEHYDAAGLAIRAFDARRMLGRVHWTAGDRGEAERHTDEAIAGLEQLPESAELAAAYSYRAQLLMLLPRPAESIQWAQRAIDLAERLGAAHVLSHAYANRGASRYSVGDAGGFDDLRLALRLALEQDRPDDAARAYTNLSAHGNMISWLPADEMEALLDEAIAYAAEKLPGGIYEQALRQARVELHLTVGRWAEAERELRQFRSVTQYNRLMVASLRGLLAAYRGQGGAALEELLPTLEEAEEVRDLQVTVPRYAALLHAYRAEGAFAEAAATLARALGTIGELRDGRLLSFLTFEGADVARAALHDGQSGHAAAVLESVASLAERNAPEASAAPTVIEADTRRALVGAAVHTLADVARELGHQEAERMSNLRDGLPAVADAAAGLDDVGRVFDAARVRLWAAESGRGPLPDGVADVFRRLDATDHLRRALSVVDASKEGSDAG